MDQQKSLEILNKCLKEIKNMSQEEFNERLKIIEDKNNLFLPKDEKDKVFYYEDHSEFRVIIKKYFSPVRYWNGYTHFIRFYWLQWIWSKIFCKLNWHLWDEVASDSDHYLSCDACGKTLYINDLR